MATVTDIKSRTLAGADGQSALVDSGSLTPLETEVIDLFVQLAHTLGQPRSAAEIYGLLFVSTHPLAMDDLIQRLEMSKGSASMGLKHLRSIGAVKSVYIPGERKTHYEAVAELKNLATRYVREQILPHLDNGLQRLETIGGMVKEEKDLSKKDRDQVKARISMLKSWEKRSRQFLSLMVRLLDKR